ncbi:MAG: aminopeptidase [Candidatus Thermoplasmatota archaeon]|nr:aminopeptidase [Candidatus Thermoplasmatota archaeon]
MAKKKKLEDRLMAKKESAWKGMSRTMRKKVFDYAEGYKSFLGKAKTERKAVNEIVSLAEENGFVEMDSAKDVRPGTRLYCVNRNKSAALFVVGKRPIAEGINIVASHIDSPRLDLKQNPLYEDADSEVALFKTHYYGGVRKYQWVNCPLALHGKVILGSGKEVEMTIGEKEDDPIFIIPDLLPHLAYNVQNKRKLPDGIRGEELNILVGHIPIEDKKVKEKIKLSVLNHLNKEYGMTEEDFVSAEFEAVPAGQPRDLGFDRGMLVAYGQDDRACAYSSLTAMVDLKTPARTCLAFFFDKEEIGSEGASGVQSRFFDIVLSELMEKMEPGYRDMDLRKMIARSKSLSADVEVAIHPTFKEVHEATNAARLGRGIAITKYTGAFGKARASDANAEYVGQIRNLFNQKRIPWQAAELGRVDEGGGGTVALFLARHNLDVLDCGPPLLAMHSPMEVSSKADIYNSYRAYLAFFRSDLGPTA